MPRIMPEPRYLSIPSIELGAEVLRNRALNCWPWARSLIHSPDAVLHSPAEIVAAWPTTVTRSRWPRAFALRTQKPFSALWKVTRSTRPASTSWVVNSGLDFIRIAGSSVLALGATSLVRRGVSAREAFETIEQPIHRSLRRGSVKLAVDGSVDIAVKYQDGDDAIFKAPRGLRATHARALVRNNGRDCAWRAPAQT